MEGWALLIFLLSVVTHQCSGEIADHLIQETRDRIVPIRRILLPVPEDMLEEAWFFMGSYIIPLDSETERCRNHSSFLFDSFLNEEMWAIRMVDAAGKPGAGIIDGNIMSLGNYDECLSVSAPGGLFQGQHCIVETRGILPTDTIDKFSPMEEIMRTIRKDVMFSVCVPDSCTAQDVKIHLDVTLNSVNATAIMYDSSCSSATSPPLDLSDYIVIMVLVIIVVLVVLSTCYEHLTAKSERKDLLVSFSITSNTSQLLSTTESPNSLPCLHGLRVLAMAWIIVGHRFVNLTLVPGSDGLKVVQNLGRLAWTPSQSIDKVLGIFFLLSGTLAAYNFLRDRLEGKKFNYLKICGHRYRRLIPPVLLVSILYATLLKNPLPSSRYLEEDVHHIPRELSGELHRELFINIHCDTLTPPVLLVPILYATLPIRVADGPIWKRMFSMYQENCQENWWINLLYISNYVLIALLLVPILYATLPIRVADGPIWKRMFSMYQETCQENWWINLLYISNYVVPYSTHRELFINIHCDRLTPPVLLVSILYATLLIRVADGPIWKRMFSMYQENCQERLTPPVLLVSILYATLLIRVADGPIWKRMFSMYQENCQESWWINLLYISNYVVPYSTVSCLSIYIVTG
ncbi:uncharacterized protein LOC124354918 [Homalodisca vitripennis]|uniref:uncharacterized protein LOC124354918 n=1 Tax=Homalodisca vitripennis TaxID=197043 RepID=UPI001EEA85B1|nr:uncharacterized protein LOC124354918 [Homalodisca vitripennis]